MARAKAMHVQPQDRLDSWRQLMRASRFSDAEAESRRLLAETEAATGPDSVDTARVLDAVVEALWRGGRARAPETKALAGRALAIQERALGAGHPDVARTLTLSAWLSADTGDLAGALALHERALAIRREALPPADPGIADSLNGLGVVFERRGDDAGAERYHREALAIREQALGPTHPDVGTSLNNLGNVQSNMGRYADARALHQRALEIRESALGPDHPDVAASLNNLAVDVRDLGDHVAAWWLLERVLGIYERRLGPAHPTVGIVCHNLAALLLDLGETAGARLLAERARRVRDRDPKRRASLTTSLNPLVAGAPPPGSHAAARALFERALRIKETALGLQHTSVAVTLTNLANVLSHLKQWDAARPMYERALAIREQALGRDHPDVADTLDRFGEFLVERGDYAAARPIFERVLATLERTYGPDHPHVGVVRQHLSEVLAAIGDEALAFEMALSTERIGRDHQRTIGRTLPEREALLYAAARPAGLNVALTLVARGRMGDHGAGAAVWDAVVRSRAAVLDEMARRHRRVRGSDDPDVARLVADLASTRERLASLVARGPGDSADPYPVELARARDARDAAERALAERSVAFQRELLESRIGLDEVRAALPPRSALVAFVRYQQIDVGPRSVSEPRASAATAYLAFVVRAGDPGPPAIVPIAPAARVDDEIARWRKQIRAAAFAGGRSMVSAEAALGRSGRRLRASLWDPLATHVADATHVFIVPDGPLHLVTWDALPARGAGYLVERAPFFHYVSAERDLVREASQAEGQGLLVVDDPVFDQRPRRPAPAPLTPAPVTAPPTPVTVTTARPASTGAVPAQRTGLRGPQPDCHVRSTRFEPLPASAHEADRITSIWRRAHQPAGAAAVSRLSGRAATESAVKQLAGRARVLHVATHGFFLGSACAASPNEPPERGAHDFAAATSPAENPLLLSGFALTGANREPAPGVDDEDGILTAEEIASLDLSRLEWAVLSACDTGVGEVRAGEGVFGLRRAFEVAGARTVIMSLWPVLDEDARRWMTSIYDRRFRRGAWTAEAVRAASLEQLRRRRRAGLSTHPFHWAAFIAAGDWR